MAKTKNLLLRLDVELAEELQAVATVEGRPVSEIVREAIRALVTDRRTDTDFQGRLRTAARDQQRLLRRLQDDA
ncbi:MAG TPA: ribbon-helix-helix protein, CopG family [Acidimicrobiales bacterium]|nr:ribbon-helix-helix protein, CopG family [Acidimicrobiales bacterium]